MDIPIACNLNAISDTDRQAHVRLAQSLFYEGRAEVEELENGYTFRYQPDSATLVELAQFVSNERLCCPFWTFTIGVEPANGPMWIRLTGPENAKDMLKAELDSKDMLSAQL